MLEIAECNQQRMQEFKKLRIERERDEKKTFHFVYATTTSFTPVIY